MCLLDTNVVSELRKPKPHGAVLDWLETIEDAQLHLSAVTIGEIQVGIEPAREQYEAMALEIKAWLEMVAASYNVLPMNEDALILWAVMTRGKRFDRHHVSVKPSGPAAVPAHA